MKRNRLIVVLLVLVLALAGCSSQAATNKQGLDEELFEKGNKLAAQYYLDLSGKEVSEDYGDLRDFFNEKYEARTFESEAEELFVLKFYVISNATQLLTLQNFTGNTSADDTRDQIIRNLDELSEQFGVVYQQ